MKENIKESLQFILQHNAIGSPLAQHAQNLARHVTLEHYSVEPQVTDEQITPTMIAAGMKWLTGFQHMRRGDRESVLEEAYKAMRALSAPLAAETPDEFHSEDAGLTTLLNLTAMLLQGQGNHDVGVHWHDTLVDLESRLKTAAAPQEAKPVAGDEIAKTRRHHALMSGYELGSDEEFHFSNGFKRAASIYAADALQEQAPAKD